MRAYLDRCIHLGAWGVVVGDLLALAIYSVIRRRCKVTARRVASSP